MTDLAYEDDDIEETLDREQDEDSTYFAALVDKEALARAIMKRVDEYYDVAERCGIVRMWYDAHRAYYGYGHGTSQHLASSIGYSGERGELVELRANQFGSLATHLFVATTDERPRFEPRARSDSPNDVLAVELAEDVLEFYMLERGLEDISMGAVEVGGLYGEAFVHLPWDPEGGEQVTNRETAETLPAGELDPDFLGPQDVVRDFRVPWHKNEWVVVREYVPKARLAAEFPEHYDEIQAIDPDQTLPWWQKTYDISCEDEQIPVYHFYHRKSKIVPGGRHAIIVSKDVCLYEGDLPYKRIPVVRYAPRDFGRSCFGYSPLWDLLALQRILDMMVSAGTTNFDAFGVQVVAVAKGSEFSQDDFGKGLALLYYPLGSEPPKGVNLTRMPEGYLEFTKFILSQMETVSGVNAVARGNPQDALGAGAPAQAMALLQNQFQKYNSKSIRAYTRMLEQVGTQIIETLQVHSEDLPRTIVRKTGNESAVRQVQDVAGRDLSGIGSVYVGVGNAATRTLPGRMAILNILTEYARHRPDFQVFDTPHDIVEVVRTGNLKLGLQRSIGESRLIQRENEQLRRGQPARVLAFDDHKNHIAEHTVIFTDLQYRNDPQLAQAALDHIQEHQEYLTQMMGPSPVAEKINPPQEEEETRGGPREGAPTEGADATMEEGPDLPVDPSTGQPAAV